MSELKKLIAILFLFVILVQSTSKLWVIGSFYLNREFIAENICINRFDAIPVCKGQCYLKKELKQSDTRDEKLPDVKIKDIQLFCQQKSLLENAIYSEPEQIQNPNYCINFYSSNFSSSVFHPPQYV